MLKSGDGTQRRGWAACVPLLLMRWVHREEYRGGQERSGVLAASSGGTAIVFSVLGLGPSAAQLACESWYPLPGSEMPGKVGAELQEWVCRWK